MSAAFAQTMSDGDPHALSAHAVLVSVPSASFARLRLLTQTYANVLSDTHAQYDSSHPRPFHVSLDSERK